MEETIPFYPEEADVVSSKVRTWNLKHPGNVFYTQLVQQRASEMTSDNIHEMKKMADTIIETILVQKGGRFLKVKDGELVPTECTILGTKRTVNKVIHALRTAQTRQELQSVIGEKMTVAQFKKQKNIIAKASKGGAEGGTAMAIVVATAAAAAAAAAAGAGSNFQSQPAGVGRKSTSPRPRGGSRRSAAAAEERIRYQAQVDKSSTPKIPKYLLELISAVCNQRDMETAHRVLDRPISGFTIESEPDKQRMMRLQILQRFAGASCIGMSPLEFASKLLKLWGGKLVLTERKLVKPKAPAGASPTVPTVPTNQQASASPKTQPVVSQSTLGPGPGAPSAPFPVGVSSAVPTMGTTGAEAPVALPGHAVQSAGDSVLPSSIVKCEAVIAAPVLPIAEAIMK